MARDPAFLFYPGDWLGGTMAFNRSHKGAYIDLLMAQFNGGHLSLDDIKMVLGSDFENMWESKLAAKFKVDESGLYFNQKLEDEIVKRKNFTKSRRDNLSGKKEVEIPHMEAHMGTHMDSHMENENEIRDINELRKEDAPKKEKKKKEPKIKFRENITLTAEENTKLVQDLGQSKTDACYNYLSSYKIEKTYKTKSDYLTILRWVVEAVNKKPVTISKPVKKKPIEEDYFSRLDFENDLKKFNDQN